MSAAVSMVSRVGLGMSAMGQLQTPGQTVVMSILESIPDIGSTTKENNSSPLRFAAGLQPCFFRPLCKKQQKVVAIPTN